MMGHEKDQTLPGGGVGLASLLVFLFLTFSRLSDAFLANLYLPLISALVAMLALVASGGLARGLWNRPAAYLAAFTAWLVVATPFSYWRGGSVDLLLDWGKSALVFLLVAGLTRTSRHCALVAGTFAVSSAVVMLQALVFGDTSVYGRLTVGEGVLSNPNDLAQLVLNGAPFLFLPLLNRGSFLVRLCALGAAVAGVAVIAATGSRGSLFAVAAMGVVVLLRQSMGRRLQIAAAAVVVVMLVVASLPSDVLKRYSTFFSVSQDEPTDETAAESGQQRLALLRESIDLTIRHPLVGIGPGVFAAASADEAGSRGDYALWRETHNAYTQVSSEAGIPALVFFLAVIGVTLRTQLRVLKSLDGEGEVRRLRNVANCLLVSFVGYVVVCLFSSIAYAIYLPAFAGFTLAVGRCSPVDGATGSPPGAPGARGDRT
jgi:O-antigen ligase